MRCVKMLLLVLSLAAFLSACAPLSPANRSGKDAPGEHTGTPGAEETSYVYKSEKVCVSLIDDHAPTKYASYYWDLITDDIAYSNNNLILTGFASNVRQVSVDYVFMDANVTDSMTLFDVNVSAVLASRSAPYQPGDVITVGVGYNMEKYGEGLPILQDGKSYLLFCRTADSIDQSTNGVLELSEYVDCWIGAPKDLLVERVGDHYLAIDYFSDVPDSPSLPERLGITEDQIASLDSVSMDDDERSALLVLRGRSGSRSYIWDLVSRAYLCPCDALEEYVKGKASSYFQP